MSGDTGSSSAPESPKGVSVKFDDGNSDDVATPSKRGVKLTGNEMSRRHMELKKWDKDGDGEIALDELLEMASSIRSFRKQRRWLAWAFLGLLIFVVVLVFTMLGVTYWAVMLAKDYKVSPSDNGLTYMSDKNGNPLATNNPHINVGSYTGKNDTDEENYKRMVWESPVDSLHRRRIREAVDDIAPAVTYLLLGTFPSSIILENIDLITSMSQLTAVLSSSDDATKTTFHVSKITSVVNRPDHIYLETNGDDDKQYDIDCPLKTSNVCFVSMVTQPTYYDNVTASGSSKRADCCSSCSCSTSLGVSACRQCGYDGYNCYLYSEGSTAYKYTATACRAWSPNCNDCKDCNGFFNNNGELCRKRCPGEAQGCASCFPENSLVTLQDGTSLPIQLLREGDMVAAVDATGKLIYSPFLTFMHSGKDQPEPYKKIVFTRSDNTSGQIHASGDHRIFTRVNADSEWLAEEPLPARHVQKGYTIFIMEGEGMKPVVVDDVTDTWLYGHYGPLTDAGTVIVSGVAASCYVESGPGHVISDMFMTPLKWVMKSKIALNGILFDAPTGARTAPPQFPERGSFVERLQNEVLIPAASYLK